MQDLRFAVRTLVARPGFSLVVTVTLAVGIGANAAIFGVVDAVLLRPLSYRDPSSLVLLQERLIGLSDVPTPIAPAELADYREGTRSFEALAGFETGEVTLTGFAEPDRIVSARVSSGIFQMLGVTPALGRTFTDTEDAEGRDDVVMLSDALWRRLFLNDRGAVGRTLSVDGRARTIVGVMPPRFQFPPAGMPFTQRAELWVPLALKKSEIEGRGSRFNLGVLGRLKPGVTLAQARADTTATADRFQKQHAQYSRIPVQPEIAPLAERITGGVKPTLFMLFGAVGFLLIVACANVANLLLARTASRRAEIVVRFALGASRRRVITHVMSETMVLAAAGAVAGVGVAAALMAALVKWGPADVPRLQEATLDLRVILFAAGLAILTAVTFGVAPALSAMRTGAGAGFRGMERGATGARRRISSALIVFETAAALVLLSGAGLLVNSFVRVLRTPPGFDAGRVITVRTALREPTPETMAAHRQETRALVERIGALDGVSSAAATSHLPLAGAWRIAFSVEGGDPERPNIAGNAAVTPGYFQTMGIPLRAGRDFDGRDTAPGPGAIIVNETLARKFWPGQDPIGKRTQWGTLRRDRPWLTVVGVVADVRAFALDAAPEPMVYMPLLQLPGWSTMTLVVKMREDRGDLDAIVPAVRAAVWSVNRDLPIHDVKRMPDVLADSVAPRRFTVFLLGSFAAVAVALAVIGLYGVMSYQVARRTRELGIRLALGARPFAVIAMILREGVLLTLAGIALGLAGAALLARYIATFLYEIAPLDPPTLAAVSALLLVTAAVAALIPARRAAGVDPLTALRAE